jgi:hypothetical protein
MSEYPTIAECSGYDDDDDDNVCPPDPFYNHDIDHSVSREDTRFDAWEGDDDWAECWEDDAWDDYDKYLDSQESSERAALDDWADRAESSDVDDPTVY